MVRYTNIINRVGSKETDIKFFKHLLPLDVDIVVEPFAGSFAVIKHFYKDINKYKFHINDKDEHLYYIYNNFQETIDIYKNLCKLYKDSFTFKDKEFKKYVDELEINEHIKHYIIISYFLRGSMFKPLKNFNYNPIEENILNNSLITNKNYKEILLKYHDNINAFLFLDPPYLFSDNTSYRPQLDETDMTFIIIDILNFFKSCKCKVMLIINKLYIISFLFEAFIKCEYKRIYQISKKSSMHLVITNY